jgi:type I restriction enzyme, S subunit
MHKMNLKSLITQIRGVSYQKGDAISVCENGYIPLLRANNIQDGDLIESGLLFIPNKLVDEKQIIKKGDIIIAASSGSINIVGKAGFSKRDTNFTFGAFCKLIRPNTKKVHPEYLNYFFQSQEYRAKISSLAQGANINNLKNENIDCLEVLIPPLPEQKRIAAILDKADALRQKNKQLLAAYDELLQSVFLDMFGDPVTNPKDWEKRKLGEFGEWKSGGTPSRSKKEYYEGNIPWLSSGELENLYVSDSNEYITEKAIAESAAKKIEVGSLLLGMYDTAALKSSVNTKILTCNQAIAFAKLDDKRINSLFVYTQIQMGKEFFRSKQRGVRQKNLNLSMIKSIELIYPPISLQNKFAQIVENIEAQKALVKQSLQKSEDLFNGLVQKAFKGELTGKE